MKPNDPILIYGYGNPGRQDDGLGVALAERVRHWTEREQMSHVTVDSNYQLQVEDVTEMHNQSLVIFADASMEEHIRAYGITPLKADPQATFSMHAVAPGYLLALCRKIYGSYPNSYLLHIRGYSWDVNEAITPEASRNLEEAWQQLKTIIEKPDLLSSVTSSGLSSG